MIRFEDVGINRKENVLKIGVASPFFLHSSDSIFSTVDKILEKGYRRLPVVGKKKELEGIVTYTDILDAFLRREDFKQPISTIMVREVIFCEKDDTLEKAVQRMKLSRRGGLPILSGRKLVGIITERDVLKRFEEKEFGIKVSEFMTKKPFFFRPMLSILDVARTIVSTKYRRFPVVEEGKVVGIITAVDVLKYIKKNEFKFSGLISRKILLLTKLTELTQRYW